MKDTLDFVGDGDDVYLVQDVEDAFAIKLTDADCERLFTVGQLHDLIEAKHADAGRTQACLSQAAFHRLRLALKSLGADREISPQTPLLVLSEIAPRSIAKKWRLLAHRAGLDLPELETPFRRRFDSGTWANFWLNIFGLMVVGTMGVGVFGVLHVLIGFSETVCIFATLVVLVLGGGFVGSLWRRLFGDIPRRLVTIGDLAREAAGTSFAKLVAEKKGSGRADRWFALQAMLRGYVGYKPAITRDTTFFAKSPSTKNVSA